MNGPIDGEETQQLLIRAKTGDAAAVEQLLTRCRERMRAFLEARMGNDLKARLDVSDIIQEAQIEMARRMTEFLEREPMPFRAWVIRTTYQNLLAMRRKHIEADCRAVGREAHLPDQSSILLADRLLDAGPQPLQQLVRDELVRRMNHAITQLSETDREIVMLRKFEGLTNIEVAQILDLEPDAASKRFGRALLRLRQLLNEGEGTTSTN